MQTTPLTKFPLQNLLGRTVIKKDNLAAWGEVKQITFLADEIEITVKWPNNTETFNYGSSIVDALLVAE